MIIDFSTNHSYYCFWSVNVSVPTRTLLGVSSRSAFQSFAFQLMFHERLQPFYGLFKTRNGHETKLYTMSSLIRSSFKVERSTVEAIIQIWLRFECKNRKIEDFLLSMGHFKKKFINIYFFFKVRRAMNHFGYNTNTHQVFVICSIFILLLGLFKIVILFVNFARARRQWKALFH